MRHVVQHPIGGDGLADILERVLDKGIVVAGDITVSLVGIELLSIKVRLIIASVEKAVELGINWWEADPTLTTQANELAKENEVLKQRLELLEREAVRRRRRRVRSTVSEGTALTDRGGRHA
jgi:hypothetical protein